MKISECVTCVTAALCIVGGLWGVLKAEDRWNQKSDVKENQVKILKVEEDMIAGMEQFAKERDIVFQEQRLQTLYDTLIQANINKERYPNDLEARERVNEIKEEIQRTKKIIEELRKDQG